MYCILYAGTEEGRQSDTVSEGEKMEEVKNEAEDLTVSHPEEGEEEDGNDSDATIVPENDMEE